MVEVHRTIHSLRAALEPARRQGSAVGFVPTMGALHDGHRSLLQAARDRDDVVVLSIFVNPLQFGPSEDLARYPRPLEADLAMAQEESVHHAFVPGVEEMYGQQPMATTVHVTGLTDVLEGAQRPGHFDGVATVVAKLLQIVGPRRAYFGEKDWQQLQVVRRLVTDLSIPVEVVGCETVRDRDGLALSSRNAYLTDQQRQRALALHRALRAGQIAVEAATTVDDVEAAMAAALSAAELQVDYATAIDAALGRAAKVDDIDRLVIAAQVGSTRLIDNVAPREGAC